MGVRFTVSLAVFIALAGCADFPALDASVSDRARQADYPKILPLEAFFRQTARPSASFLTGPLPTRARNLRARAQALRGPVIDPASRARMQAALARHAG